MFRFIKSKHRLLALASPLILCVSLGLFLSAGWIQIKAYAAQYLLEIAWNKTLASTNNNNENHVVKPWSWADTWPVARLSVPKFKQNYLILEGMHGQSLAFGPGRVTNQEIFGVDLAADFRRVSNKQPINLNNHSRIIAGHKDTHFKFLQYLNIGDLVLLQNNQGLWTEYTVSNTEVAVPIDGRIPISESQEEISLITCYPFTPTVAPSEKRYIVTLVPLINSPMI